MSSESKKDSPLPRPVIKKMRWPFPIIWAIPILAALAAGYYLYQWHKDHGREIVIEFADAGDIHPEETSVTMRGAQVGQVTAMTISPDHRHAQVHVRLKGSDDSISRQGAEFWIVRPDFSSGSFSGLGTIVSGAYIEALPGDGPVQTQFAGLEKPPVANGQGMRFILYADRVDKLQIGTEVQYRGLQVGVVQDIRLASDSTKVNATIYIFKRFLPLVRTNSKFWIVSSADVHGSVLTGVHVKLGSLQTFISGGVAFATPDPPGHLSADGSEYILYPEPDDQWLKWAPHIEVDDGVPGKKASASSAKPSVMINSGSSH